VNVVPLTPVHSIISESISNLKLPLVGNPDAEDTEIEVADDVQPLLRLVTLLFENCSILVISPEFTNIYTYGNN